MKRAALLLALGALSLAGCGLRPLYSGGASGPAAQALGEIEIGPIAGKNGWLVRSALADRLAAVPKGAARYRLEVELDDQIIGYAIRSDDAVTRERRTLRARYRLVANDKGTVMLDATAGSDTGIDIVSSEYATIAAENTALENMSQAIADQIVARIALFAARTKDLPAADTP